MTAMIVITSETFSLFVLPVLIFLARIVDVSLSTLRIIFISRDYKHISAVIGFFEVLVWLLAIGQIMQNLTNPINYIAYAGGFSSGTYVGMCIENKLKMGNRVIRIITKKKPNKLIKYLKTNGYGVTIIDAKGGSGPSKVILTMVKRKDLDHVIRIIKDFNPKAFYSIEDVKYVSKGKFPAYHYRNRRKINSLMRKRK